MFYQMFTVRGLTWYCGGTLWIATFSKQRVCDNFQERLSDSSPVCLSDTEPVNFHRLVFGGMLELKSVVLIKDGL